MNRIDKLFQSKGSDILSVYYPAGYPSLDDTMDILVELESKGVDMVEIGVPFSDPMADGVVIQEAATAALKNGISQRKIFEQLKDMRSKVTMPVILMGYLNPIMQYGFENFCKSCQEVGVDGVIIPDLPYRDYMSGYRDVADQYGINVIMLITPETSHDRIRHIDANTSGFIYMVSTAATTGAQSGFGDSTIHYFKDVEAMKLRNPRLIGFGISNEQTYKAACENCSGAIVGSHFVKLLASQESIAKAVEALIKSLARG